ncbi:MAG: hypothetical protein EBT86_08450 [Actinobacteria bacterium]|nr:hypothetical protein [Actinomycetota bacterium]
MAKRNAADSEDNPETISWNALGHLTQNTIGQRIDSADSFGPRFQANPAFDQICSFDDQGVHLKTRASEMPSKSGGDPNAGNLTKSMAKSALNRRR